MVTSTSWTTSSQTWIALWMLISLPKAKIRLLSSSGTTGEEDTEKTSTETSLVARATASLATSALTFLRMTQLITRPTTTKTSTIMKTRKSKTQGWVSTKSTPSPFWDITRLSMARISNLFFRPRCTICLVELN